MSLSSFIAWRYLRFKDKDRNIAFMIKVCFLGIMIGTFALMLTLIITNGFEKAISEKMQNINAHIIISARNGNKLNYENIRQTLLKEFPNDIQGIGGNSVKQVLIENDDTHTVLFLKGIDEKHEHTVTTLAEKITFPLARNKEEQKLMLINLLKDNQIIIGAKTAENLKLRTGDTVTLLIPEAGGRKKIMLNEQEGIISGIFKIGLEEYDNNCTFASLDFLHQVFDEEGVEQVTIALQKQKPISYKERFINLLTPDYHEQTMIKKLKKRLPSLEIHSWKDLYPALVSSLKLEKYVMFFILALITLVASMNMISLLFMQIQHKRKDIAIFKAMGLADNKIQSIFLHLGLTITLSASLIGLGLAALAGTALERYPFIELPDVYYISYLPARMDIEIFVIVFITTMLLGFFATWFPAKRTKKINVAEVLRQE